MQLVVYGIPFLIGAWTLLLRVSNGKLRAVDWVIAAAWSTGLFVCLPVFLRLRTKKGVRTLTVAAEGISTRIGKLSGDVPWEKVARIDVTDEYIFITRTNLNAFVVPRRAFSDDNQRAEFISLCDNYRSALK
jgi:YcxB-like protein